MWSVLKNQVNVQKVYSFHLQSVKTALLELEHSVQVLFVDVRIILVSQTKDLSQTVSLVTNVHLTNRMTEQLHLL